METWLVPGAHLELAPVFFGAAFLLSAGLLRAARRRRSPRALTSVLASVLTRDLTTVLTSDLTIDLTSDLPAEVPAD